MANTEWWQRGPIDGVPAVLQPVAHILLQVRESVGELVDGLAVAQWNARPGGAASSAFHVRHIAGVIDRLFTYARGESLSEAQFAALRREGEPMDEPGIAAALSALDARVDAALAQLLATDPATLGEFRGVGRAQLPSTVIGCLVHGAEHAMRHVGQLSVTARLVRTPVHQITPLVHVPHLPQALHLLRDILAFVVKYEEPGYAYLELEGCGLRVLEEPARVLTPDGKARMTVYVDVSDVDALYNRLRPNLAQLPEGDVEPPRDKPWRQREFMVRLPDGDWIAFGQAVRSLPAPPLVG